MKNVATPSATETTARKTASPLRLLATAAGGPRQWRDKLARLAGTVALYASQREIDRRLARLAERGYLTQIPTRAQLGFGGLDMVQFFIVPGAADYYETQGIDFRFHQVLRFLDDPVSVIDPVGLLSRRDTIIGHLMQVTHANPIYDLQILDMFDDGLEALERELEQMLAGTHPRAGTISAIVETRATTAASSTTSARTERTRTRRISCASRAARDRARSSASPSTPSAPCPRSCATQTGCRAASARSSPTAGVVSSIRPTAIPSLRPRIAPARSRARIDAPLDPPRVPSILRGTHCCEAPHGRDRDPLRG
ncbi:MAG: hypothetical protein IPK07_06155 [Deltaproteobacteria bacterium]|nr:hypothetical protein [Deltaproteobacteria bacterium]